MKRTLFVAALAAALVLALAVPAFAADSATIYGKATIAPYAITVSGAGADSNNPLVYEGAPGDWALEKFGDAFTVTNVGSQTTALSFQTAQNPTDGTDSWPLVNEQQADETGGACWVFAMPMTVMAVTDDGALDEYDPLHAGDSLSIISGFTFPRMVSSTADHYMQATITAIPVN